jgi:hypothetical protein
LEIRANVARMRVRSAASSSPSAPPEKASGLVQAVTPTGASIMSVTVPAAAFPAAPALIARAGASTEDVPAASSASPVVSKRTSPAVRQTVPASTVRSCAAAPETEKRSVPDACAASLRLNLAWPRGIRDTRPRPLRKALFFHPFRPA